MILPLLLILGALVRGGLGAQDCEVARMKCAYRSSCARALHSYMVDCADVLAGRPVNRCPWACKRALISLTSSEAGLALADCDCAPDNEFCRRSRERVEVCRPEVAQATARDTVVSCSVAQWICEADPLCHTALDYYHRLCKSLFHGRKCTPRCNNSLAILDRQDKAFKLRGCYCDGSEDFPCLVVRENTRRLCYGDESVDLTRTTSAVPDPGSGSRTVDPERILILGALLAVVVWWCGRDCVGDFGDEMGSSRLCTVVGGEDGSVVERDGLGRRCAPAVSSASVWPWWWTSECAEVI